jgi:hypothetical protein
MMSCVRPCHIAAVGSDGGRCAGPMRCLASVGQGLHDVVSHDDARSNSDPIVTRPRISPGLSCWASLLKAHTSQRPLLGVRECADEPVKPARIGVVGHPELSCKECGGRETDPGMPPTSPIAIGPAEGRRGRPPSA